MDNHTKVFFFDIDGTLIDGLNGVRTIPVGVVSQLERLHRKGHKLVICSGRPYAMIGPELRLPLFDAYVMCNGAHVEADGQTLFADIMETKAVRHYVALFEELGMEYMLQTAHHIYLDQRFHAIQKFFAEFNTLDIFTYDFNKADVLRRTIKLEANLTEDDYDRMMTHMEGKTGFVAHMDGNGSYNAFEIYSPAISKAVGIEKVLHHYGVPVEDSLGFGDGINDCEMIQLVGHGVAMGNACAELKAVADDVCGNVTEDGLAHYLASIS